jgi:hypothetical protein
LERIKKNTRENFNPIAILRLPQIPALYLAAPRACHFALPVNCTKMFHVKHFCPIGVENLTKLMDKLS